MEPNGLLAVVTRAKLPLLKEELLSTGSSEGWLYHCDISVAESETGRGPLFVIIRSASLMNHWERVSCAKAREILEKYTDKKLCLLKGVTPLAKVNKEIPLA